VSVHRFVGPVSAASKTLFSTYGPKSTRPLIAALVFCSPRIFYLYFLIHFPKLYYCFEIYQMHRAPRWQPNRRGPKTLGSANNRAPRRHIA
jgi:hypothetical protein